MKKIVGIIAALALVSAVFADEPSVTPVTSEFTGNAKLEWIADLDGETTGMANATEASFKLKFVTEGTTLGSSAKAIPATIARAAIIPTIFFI